MWAGRQVGEGWGCPREMGDSRRPCPMFQCPGQAERKTWPRPSRLSANCLCFPQWDPANTRLPLPVTQISASSDTATAYRQTLGVLALIHCHPVRRKALTVVRFAEKLIVTQFVVIRLQSSKLP